MEKGSRAGWERPRLIPNTRFAFGGGATDSAISSFTIGALLLTIVLVWVLPRRHVIIPFLLFAFLIPLGQQFYIGGVHLFAVRIVILCATLRVLAAGFSSNETVFGGGFNGIDKIFLVWALFRTSAFLTLNQESAAIINQAGFIWDTLGGYVLARCLIRDEEDIRRTAKVLVFIAMLTAASMVYEHLTMTNVSGYFWGQHIPADVRNGKIRARGLFGQEILAGTFGGTLVPLFLWLWWSGRAKLVATVGLISSGIIVMAASSSTGISAGLAAIGALFCWPIRKYMRAIRWGIVLSIAAAATFMKAPIWFLLQHVDFVGGSTGWDRANLIDQFARHFGDWWLIGTNNNASWGDFTWDLCNQFAAEAGLGGLGTLLLFSFLLVYCFAKIGIARKRAEGNKAREWLMWTMGALLVAHTSAFVGIDYFDQTKFWWFITLAMISVATSKSFETEADSELEEAEEVAPEVSFA